MECCRSYRCRATTAQLCKSVVLICLSKILVLILRIKIYDYLKRS